MPIDLAASAYILSLVASTAKLIEFALGLKHAVPQMEVEKVIQEASRKAAKSGPSSELLAMTEKGGPIQEAFKKRVYDIQKRIVDIASDTTLDPVQRRTMLNNDKRAFCEELKNLRDWNGGVLPPDLQREWDAAQCNQFRFY